MKIFRILSIIITVFGSLMIFYFYQNFNYAKPVSLKRGAETVQSVIQKIDIPASGRWQPYFDAKNINITDISALTLIGLKKEKQLEFWVQIHGQWIKLRTMPILGASGGIGHKFRQGDWQVPEGLYNLDYLNPNSQAHLSVHVNYPNTDDKAWAKEENRRNLGGDIMIHGKRSSIGCLAMGDVGAEDIFWLIYKIGLKNSDIIISPYDMRIHNQNFPEGRIAIRYQQIKEALQNFR